MNTPKTRLIKHSSNLLNPVQVHTLAGTLLFMAAYHVFRSDALESYYGTEDLPWHDINLGNSVTEFAERFFDVDFDDGEEDYNDDSVTPWSKAIMGATMAEISKLLVNAMLRELTEARVVDATSPLYIVLCETPGHTSFFDDPISNSDDDNVQLWSANKNMTTDCGWSDEEASAIAALLPFNALVEYGDFAHTIIRIR